jgi:hypothetical protein
MIDLSEELTDNDRCLVAAKLRQRVILSEGAAQISDIERFNLKKPNV